MNPYFSFFSLFFLCLRVFVLNLLIFLIIGEPQPKEQMPLLGQLRGL